MGNTRKTDIATIQAGKQDGKESNSKAKARAMNELYEEQETPVGERKIYRIAKANAFAKNNQIKDSDSDSDLFYFVSIQHSVTVMYIKIMK